LESEVAVSVGAGVGAEACAGAAAGAGAGAGVEARAGGAGVDDGALAGRALADEVALDETSAAARCDRAPDTTGRRGE
jgi:hypothetical protein